MSTAETMTGTVDNSSVSLGMAVPPFTPHAISVSLPAWRDNVGYEEGEKRVLDSMVSGYPRFFIHLSIEKLARIYEQKFGVKDERCMLFPTKKIADQCRSFIQDHSSRAGSPVHPRLIHLLICPDEKASNGVLKDSDCGGRPASTSADLHIVLFPTDTFPLAKQFWQHSGMGISSRRAEHCLAMLSDEPTQPRSPSPTINRLSTKGLNKHYSVKDSSSPSSPNRDCVAEPPPIKTQVDELNIDQSVYLEERYGRNLPLASAAYAKRALRRRISGVLVRDSPDDCPGVSCAGGQNVELGPSSRGVVDVSENDVYLYPTGMSAIWNAHNLALTVRPPAKSVCFGFPYTDTLKILQKWGPGCYFLGHGLDADIDELETILEKESKRDPTTPPVLALFAEFPSNPLLRSADLPRLRGLADKYEFLIVIDETIGNFVNVEVLCYADIVVSSLSKVFSGSSNVMGGSLVLNPKSRYYTELKTRLIAAYEDVYFDEDAIYMERNSRDFKRRIKAIDANTEAVCDFLRARSAAGGAPLPVIKEVFYPKYITRNHYEHCRIKKSDTTGDEGGGFGGLFSLTFTSRLASQTFFDSLSCYKGPSLGTNFTLACPFTILAHYAELDWAAQYGVEEGLVRISVGMEQTNNLLLCFEKALHSAEVAVNQQ